MNFFRIKIGIIGESYKKYSGEIERNVGKYNQGKIRIISSGLVCMHDGIQNTVKPR